MPSIVWEYFDEFEGGGKCRLCGCIRNRKDKSTSTFWQHLERVHGLDKRQMMVNSHSLAPMGGGGGGGRAQQQQQQQRTFSVSGMIAGGAMAMGEHQQQPQHDDSGGCVGEPPVDKMPKLDLADSLGLDRRATEETFRFISELVRQQQSQSQSAAGGSSTTTMPALDPSAADAAAAAGNFVVGKRDPFERVDHLVAAPAPPPIGINKRNDLVEAKRKRAVAAAVVELPPTPPPSQLSMSSSLSLPPSSLSSSSAQSSSSSSLLLNNYLNGILDFANSPLSLASITTSVMPSPSPRFASPISQLSGQQQQQMIVSQSQQNNNNNLALNSPPKQSNGSTTTLTVPTNKPSASPTKKRTDYLVWDEFFMGTAILAAQRSKDPKTQVGSCIVKDNIIVGIGYNGMPIGCNDDEMPWGKEDADPLNTKYLYVCHAEMNAILNKNSADISGSTIYTTLFPCAECAKMIIQSRIKRVVYLRDKEAVQMDASRRLFTITGIAFSQFEPIRPEVVLRFK